MLKYLKKKDKERQKRVQSYIEREARDDEIFLYRNLYSSQKSTSQNVLNDRDLDTVSLVKRGSDLGERQDNNSRKIDGAENNKAVSSTKVIERKENTTPYFTDINNSKGEKEKKLGAHSKYLKKSKNVTIWIQNGKLSLIQNLYQTYFDNYIYI